VWARNGSPEAFRSTITRTPHGAAACRCAVRASCARTGCLGGFIRAIVMTPVAYLVERRPSGPPALVSFLPAFWLLVPGALGLIRVTEYLGKDAVAGVQDFLSAVGSMVAIALGVLCGYPLYRSLARSLGWLQEFGLG
jgi:uncharacterized membrane protein YjjB (DUF3815 family)